MCCQLLLRDLNKAGKSYFISNMRIKSCLSVVPRYVSVYHSRPQAKHTWGHTDEEGEYSLYTLIPSIAGDKDKNIKWNMSSV